MMNTFLLLANAFLLHLSFRFSETSFYEFCPLEEYPCPYYPTCYNENGSVCPEDEVCCNDYFCTVTCKSTVEYLGCYTEDYTDTCGEGEFCCYNYKLCTHTCQSKEAYNGCYSYPGDTCEDGKICCEDYIECRRICKEPAYFKERCPENLDFTLYDLIRFCPPESLGLTDCCDYFQTCCKSSCLDLNVCAYTSFKQAKCPPPEDVQCSCHEINCETCGSPQDCNIGQFCCPGTGNVNYCRDLDLSGECPPPEEVQSSCILICDTCENNQTCTQNDQLCCPGTDGIKCCQEPEYFDGFIQFK